MRLHPTIPGTVWNYPFQGSMKDTSGNGFDLVTNAPSTGTGIPPAPGGTEQYTAIDACTQGFKFDGNTQMVAPFSTLFQITGDITVQWIMKEAQTYTQCYFTCAHPTGRRTGRGSGPDNDGSVYTVGWLGAPGYTTENIGSNIPTSTYGDWLMSSTAFGVPNFHVYAWRIMTVSGVRYADLFMDGVKFAGTITDLGTAASGDERFYVGGMEGGGNSPMGTNSVLASLRGLNYGRSDALIAADAAAVLGPCAANFLYRGLKLRIGGAS